MHRPPLQPTINGTPSPLSLCMGGRCRHVLLLLPPAPAPLLVVQYNGPINWAGAGVLDHIVQQLLLMEEHLLQQEQQELQELRQQLQP